MDRATAESSRRLVSEAMTTAVVAVAPDLAVEEARRLAVERGAHHLLVLDEGTLVGILCRCDLDEAESGALVSDCMSVPVMTVRPDASLEAAAATMADFEVGCLPVVTGGLILGLLSEEELAGAGVPAPRSGGRPAASRGRPPCPKAPRGAGGHAPQRS